MITYYLVAGLLEIGSKCPQLYEEITSTLWAYAEFIIKLLPENGKKKM
jgi:phosphatidylinositol 4-kinase